MRCSSEGPVFSHFGSELVELFGMIGTFRKWNLTGGSGLLGEGHDVLSSSPTSCSFSSS